MAEGSGLGRLASAASSRLGLASLELGSRLGELSAQWAGRRPADHPPPQAAARGARAAGGATSTCAPPPDGPTPAQRANQVRELLYQNPVPLRKLAKLIFVEGVPDVGGDSSKLRAITWKLMFGYLPVEHEQWKPHLDAQRQLYHQWVRELTVDPNALMAAESDKDNQDIERVDADFPTEEQTSAREGSTDGHGVDHPLSTHQRSVWREWHQDEELRQEIRKDVDRTLPDYSFFNREQVD